MENVENGSRFKLFQSEVSPHLGLLLSKLLLLKPSLFSFLLQFLHLLHTVGLPPCCKGAQATWRITHGLLSFLILLLGPGLCRHTNEWWCLPTAQCLTGRFAYQQIIFLSQWMLALATSVHRHALARPQAAPVKEPLTDSQLCVESHDISRKQQEDTKMLLNCRTSASLDGWRCYRSAAGSESGWRHSGVGWTVRGGPSAGCAGWDGAGWFPLPQLKELTRVNTENQLSPLRQSDSHWKALHWSIPLFSGLGIAVTRLVWK